MKKKAKIIILALAAIAVAGAVAASALLPMEVDAVRLAPKEAYAYFVENGVVTEGDDFSVYSEVEGSIIKVAIEKGDFVNVGDVILEIEKNEYMRQRIIHLSNIEGYTAQIDSAVLAEHNTKDEYNATIASLKEQLAQIDAQRKTAEAARISTGTVEEQLKLLSIATDKAKADAAVLKQDLDKLTVLYDAGAVAEAELDKTKTAYDDTLRVLAQYETEYSQLNNKTDADDLAKIGNENYYLSKINEVNKQISFMNENLGKDYSGATSRYYEALIEAEKAAIDAIDEKLEKCTVKAPVSGFVTELPAKSALTASPQSVLAVIKSAGDGSAAKIDSYVATQNVAMINEGDRVELILKGRDKDSIFTGVIASVSDWAETRETTLGLSEKMVPVTIEASKLQGDAVLRPGYDVDVKFTIFREDNKILVPTGAVFSSNGDDFVFTIKNGKAVKTQITKGVKTLTETVVESGLSSGDVVISDRSAEGLSEGSRVKSRQN